MGIISSLLRKNVGIAGQSPVESQAPATGPSNAPAEGPCRIFKVLNENIRAENVESFQPKILSIGPYHHGSSYHHGFPRESREDMESVKLICRRSILGSDSENRDDRDIIRELPNDPRSFYSQDITMGEEEFARMLLVDGCFILSALTGMRNVPSGTVVTMGRRGVDLTQHELLHRHDIVRDLLLVENQIPFFVLEEIHKLAAPGETAESLKQKIAKYVEGVLRQYPKAISSSDFRSKEFHHLLHLCHMFFQPSEKPAEHHCIQTRIQCFPCSDHSHHTTNQWHRAMQYREAGVEFRVKDSSPPHSHSLLDDSSPSHSHSLLDVTFSNGTMEIPQLSIDAKTESIFSNLIKFERGCPHAGKYINAYVTFMSQLLSDADDVKLLAREKIVNILGPQEEAVKMFTRLNGLAVIDPSGEDYYLASTYQSVDAHYRCRFNWWMAWLKHNHLTNPCVAFAALLALMALLCGIINQLLSILQHFNVVHH